MIERFRMWNTGRKIQGKCWEGGGQKELICTASKYARLCIHGIYTINKG